MVRLLCFSDIHCNVDAVNLVLKDVQSSGIAYDAAIFAGDFTNLILDNDPVSSQSCYDLVVEQTSGLCGLFYYVFGNRDESRAGFTINPRGSVLDPGKRYRLAENLWVTATPELIDENTIYVEHSPFLADASGQSTSGSAPRVDSYRIFQKALLHMAGHTHKGLFVGKYLNTGFVYLDDAHGDTPTLGGYCEVLIEGPEVNARFHSIGPLREKPFCLNGYSGRQFTTRDLDFLNLTYF